MLFPLTGSARDKKKEVQDEKNKFDRNENNDSLGKKVLPTALNPDRE